MTFNPQAPATQADPSQTPSDSGAIPSSSDASQSAPAAVADPSARIDKLEQDLRTKYGRETAEARRQADAAAQVVTRQAEQISRLETQLTQIGNHLSREQQAREDAIIAQLPPEHQALKRIERLEQRLTNPQTGTAGAQPRPAAPVTQTPPRGGVTMDQIAARAKEIAESVGTQFGVTIEPDDIPQSAWANERTFREVVTAIGKTKASANGVPPVAGKKPEGASSEVEQLRTELNTLKRQMGVSGPNSPASTTPPKPGGVTEQHYQDTNWAYSSKKGPRANRAALEALRDNAKAALPKD